VNRWITYQRERFPLLAHAPLVAAFSASAVCYSRLVRGEPGLPPGRPLLVAFATALLFFLQLRISDEYKDYEDDARFRPYRPVPRGLVSLRELGWIGFGAGLVQLALALWLNASLVWLLILAWCYLALMSREFFVPEWLKARPSVYLASHMVIIPLIDLYATACDWLVAGRIRPPAGLYWFLIVSYFNGIVVELGRKIRAPQDEEPGVETYSAVWGRTPAVTLWLTAIVVTALVAWQAALRIHFERPVIGILVLLVGGCVIASVRFVRRPETGAGKTLEIASGIWTLLMYLSLGALPALLGVRPTL
jgi:4-hydroxybenzoate polyprenyltransferase